MQEMLTTERKSAASIPIGSKLEFASGSAVLPNFFTSF